MENPAVQQSLFSEIAADLPDRHQAEFFRNLHEAGIGPNDVELAKLLRVLQLYKTYYESIPEAVRKAAAEMERITKHTRGCADASALLAGQMLEESIQFRQEVSKIRETIGEALTESTEALVQQTAQSLESAIEKNVLLPLKNRIHDLAQSNLGFEEAIARSDSAAKALRRNADLTRHVHLGTYILASLTAVVLAVMGSWFYLNQVYMEQLGKERAALLQEISQNRTVLLELAKSHRTLQLVHDPQHPERKLLAMKDASAWQSNDGHGVLEFASK